MCGTVNDKPRVEKERKPSDKHPPELWNDLAVQTARHWIEPELRDLVHCRGGEPAVWESFKRRSGCTVCFPASLVAPEGKGSSNCAKVTRAKATQKENCQSELCFHELKRQPKCTELARQTARKELLYSN